MTKFLPAVLLAVAIGSVACSRGGSNGASVDGAANALNGYLSTAPDAAMFLQWVTANGTGTGTLDRIDLDPSTPDGIQVERADLTLVRSGNQVTLKLSQNSGPSSTLSGMFSGSSLTVYIPSGTGTIVPVVLQPGTLLQYNNAVAALRQFRVQIGSLTVNAEVARTPEERTQGLSGRASLAQDAGMLFVFPNEQEPVFWMKDMRFPLDFIWISADQHVEGVTKNVPPPVPGTLDGALPQYLPPSPIHYVLEVNAGVADGFGVHVGDPVAFTPKAPTQGVR